MQNASPNNNTTQPGPPYYVNIEGERHPWAGPTITTEQIAELGGFDASLGVIVIDRDNNERTLAPGEVVELQPGMGFAKKVRFRRGRDRVDEELRLVRELHPNVEVAADGWIRLPAYQLPTGWNPAVADLAFQIPAGYPGAQPYGIYVQPAALTFLGIAPTNYNPMSACPLPGDWGVFSWQPEVWMPAATPTRGTNLVNWILGFRTRFSEGA